MVDGHDYCGPGHHRLSDRDVPLNFISLWDGGKQEYGLDPLLLPGKLTPSHRNFNER